MGELDHRQQSPEWGTPPDLFERLNKLFNFTLDPAATHENALCDTHFTKKEDGLWQSWAGHTVFCNPPYNNLSTWVRKMYEESRRHGITVVGLLIVRTDRRWWQTYVSRADIVIFLPGRLRFICLNGRKKGEVYQAKHWNCVVIWNNTVPIEELKKIATIWRPDV